STVNRRIAILASTARSKARKIRAFLLSIVQSQSTYKPISVENINRVSSLLSRFSFECLHISGMCIDVNFLSLIDHLL
ncbi:hypothetical protein PENTCL1PPCAC_20912, partial [Pristionchus entomophagus]